MKHWTLSAFLALGCASAQVTATTTVTAATTATERGIETTARPLELHATATVLATRQPLRDGMTLHSGNTLRLAVEVTRPAFVFLAYVDKNDRLVVLHAGTERVEPGVPVQVPSNQDLILDTEVGEEHLVLVASERPLAESDPELHAAFHDASSVATPAAPPPAATAPAAAPNRRRERARPQPAAPAASPAAATPSLAVAAPEPTQGGAVVLRHRPRGFNLTPSNNAAPLAVRADDGGVVAWRVDFHHAP